MPSICYIYVHACTCLFIVGAVGRLGAPSVSCQLVIHSQVALQTHSVSCGCEVVCWFYRCLSTRPTGHSVLWVLAQPGRHIRLSVAAYPLCLPF